MKKLLGLLGTILVTGNAIPSVVAVAPNRKHSIKKRQTTPTNEENQQTKTGTSNNSQVGDSATEFIEKEITLNEDYSHNIQKILQELIKNNQLDPLRMINNGGIVRTDYFETQDKRNEREYNIKIIEKLDEILELRKFDANKIRILVLTLKNKENNEIKLIINLDNFYVQGFINNEDQYFYFKEEKSLNEWRQEIKKLTEKLNEWNKINEEIKLLDLKKINNNHHIINKIDEIKENLKKQLGTKENKEKIDLLNKNLFDQIQINNEDSESISKLLNELKENVEKLEKEKIYLGQEKINAYQKIQQIRQKSINLINKINKTVKLDKKEYEENIKKYQWNNVFNKITSIIESKINTIQYKKIKENKINEEIIKKYSINKNKKHILNYNGSYQNKGLNVVNQNIDVTKRNLNNAITNLSFLNKENNQNQITKDDLARVIFITSEAMRFGSNLKHLNYEKDGKQIEFKNIPEDIQNIINSINDDKIQWKNYSEQLMGGWIASSKYVEEKRKEIFKKLDYEISYFEVMNNFLNDKKLIKKYNFKFVYTEFELKKIEEIWKNYEQQIKKIKERENEFEKIGLEKLILKELEKYNKYINNGEFEKVLAELNQKKEFKIKIQKKEEKLEQKYLTKVKIIQKSKEDISNEIKIILDKKEIDKILENEIFKILINKDKFNKIKNVLEEILKKLKLDKEKKYYIIEKFILNSKAILKCDFLNTAKKQINFWKNSKYFVVPNQSFDFFSEENFEKIIDKNFLISLVLSSNIDILKLILLKNVNVNIKNEIWLSPLNCAIFCDNLEIVKLLLVNGANPNLVNNNGNTSLFFAAIIDCSLEIVEELINNGANVNKQNNNGDNPLHIAIRNNHEAITKLLIENCADVNKLGFLNQTPLSIATFQSSNIDIVKHLLNHPQINVNISDFAVLELFSLNNRELTQILKQKLNSKGIKKTEEEIKEKVQEYKKNKKQTQDKIKNLSSLSNEVINQFISNPRSPNFIIQNQDMFKDIDKKNLTKITKTSFNQNPKDKSGFGGFKSGFLNKKNKSKNDNSNISIGDQPGTSGIQNKKYEIPDKKTGGQKIQLNNINIQNTKTIKNENNNYDVRSDGSCLFWAVASAYLLPVRNNNQEFKKLFIKLFGKLQLSYLSYVQNLYKEFDLENHSSIQNLYQDSTMNRLVRSVFRNRVVDYTESHLDTIINHNGELTFRNLIEENNEIVNNYLERMREPATWGGTPEIIAMANILNANISVNSDDPYQPINQNSSNTINLFHVNDRTHYNFVLTPEEYKTNHLIGININRANTPVVNTTNRPNNLPLTNIKSEIKTIKLTVDDHYQHHVILSNNNEEKNKINTNAPVVNKPISTNKNMENLQKTTKNAINKYNSLSKEKKQQKLNEINQHYQNLSEDDKKDFKDHLKDVGLGLTSTGISGAGILGISKMTGISPIKSLSTTANYIKNSLSNTRTVVSTGTGEAVEMTPLLSESTVAEGLTAAETLSITEGSTVVATEGAVIGTEAGTAAALAPETLGLSLVIGGLVIAGTAILWWINSNHTIVKHESHNKYNEIEKYYKFLAHDQLKLDININEWNKIKQIYQENSNNYQEFKNKIKSEITNFHKEDHSGWGGSINDEDINTLINIIYNHFQEINNHFLSNPNHGWKIITNTVGSYFIIEEE